VATLFLCGDVMTGRGVDQIQRHPGDPTLHEPYVSDAREYVRMAERANGPLPTGVEPDYIWGDALGVWTRFAPDARIINLETSITRHDAYWPDKVVHYRMHPSNVACLVRARPDLCVLANNHVLDYGHAGLEETLEVLEAAGLKTVGAGRDAAEAQRAAVLPLSATQRAIVVAVGHESSGVPRSWCATPLRSGVDVVNDLSDASADILAQRLLALKTAQDVAIVSIHWGSNWGYEVPAAQVRFAHRLIDAGVDVIYGHSSHHPRPIEIYQNRLILYGCGDFIDDYEGIAGYEAFRDDLVLMYFATFEPCSGTLIALRMVPLRIARMALRHAVPEEARWLERTLDDVCRPYGSRISAAADGTLELFAA
jgi:poly-gamma-glutamate capsule biosynthesis protein CapA/YwtB (metallophosphatase superfamily)